jgi:hypothetical protein
LSALGARPLTLSSFCGLLMKTITWGICSSLNQSSSGLNRKNFDTVSVQLVQLRFDVSTENLPDAELDASRGERTRFGVR